MKKLKLFRNKKAEGYVDSGVKILIAVVLGALLLSGIYAMFNTIVMPEVNNKVESLFNYGGGSGNSQSTSAEDDVIVYPIVESQINADGSEAVYFVADMDPANLQHFTLDGAVITPPYVSPKIQSNGIYVSLSAQCVASLTSGQHVFRFVATDGYAEAIITK